jgi:acyl-CoA synthetase (AMP-forming)/AMP-acid ligase II
MMTDDSLVRIPEQLQAQWRAAGLWNNQGVFEAIEANAKAKPDACLVSVTAESERTTTLAAFVESARAIATGLRNLGLGPGDVVAVQLPTGRECWLSYAAVAAIGATLVPIVPIYGAKELEFIINDSGARALISQQARRGVDYDALVAKLACPNLRHHVSLGDQPRTTSLDWRTLEAQSPSDRAAVDPSARALLIYTSGTSGVPKGVQHSSETILAEILNAPRQGVDPNRSVLSPWPSGHVTAYIAFLRYAMDGLRTVLMDSWDPKAAVGLIDRHRITSCSGTPFHLMTLLESAQAAGSGLPSMFEFILGATTVSPDLIERCAAFGIRAYRSYGSSEHPTVTTGSISDPDPLRYYTEGRLNLGCEIRIIDDEGRDVPYGVEGEVVSRGPDRALGYLRAEHNAAAFLEGGWVKSGDIGTMNALGFLRITDRKKDLIIRGGENLSSREIEDYLARHPKIRVAGVVGMPDVRLGERVCAVLETHDGQDMPLAEVQSFFAELQVARQKTPERLMFLTLPRNAAGKIDKVQLRQWVREAIKIGTEQSAPSTIKPHQ